MNKHLSRYKKMVQYGKFWFVLKYGLFYWGLSTGILGSSFQYLKDNDFQFSMLLSKEYYYYFVTFTLMTLLFGLFWGLILWKIVNDKINS